jgi:hypothetical protein
MWDFVMDKWRWGTLSPRTSVSPDNLHSICISTIIFTIIRGWYNRPVLATVPKSPTARIKKKKLVAGFPPRRPGFKHGSGHVRFCNGQMALGHVISENFGFPCQSTFHLHLTIIFTIIRGWHNRPGVAAVPIASQTKKTKTTKKPVPKSSKLFVSFVFSDKNFVWISSFDRNRNLKTKFNKITVV